MRVQTVVTVVTTGQTNGRQFFTSRARIAGVERLTAHITLF